MPRIFSLCLAVLVACSDGGLLSLSQPASPALELTPPPLEVVQGWPCAPFGTETTQDRLGDRDADSISDCQEDQIGSDAADPDSDGDGAGDFYEIGEVTAPLDTDRDSLPDLLDEDDDGDGCLSADEDADGDGSPLDDDTDGNGIPDFLDAGTADC